MIFENKGIFTDEEITKRSQQRLSELDELIRVKCKTGKYPKKLALKHGLFEFELKPKIRK